MTKKRKPNICSQCGEPTLKNVRRTRVYKSVVIENLPATCCTNCGEELYDAATVDLMMERIGAEPEHYAQMMEMPVARVA